MKLDWEKVAVLCMGLLVLLLVGVTTITQHYQNSLHFQAMKEGYSQAAVPGMTGVFWVKDGKRHE